MPSPLKHTIKMPPAAELEAAEDKPTRSELVGRYGGFAEIPAGAVEYSETGRPLKLHVGQGWTRAVTDVGLLDDLEGAVARRLAPKTPTGEMPETSRFVVTEHSATEDIAAFLKSAREINKASHRGASAVARLDRGVLNRIEDASKVSSVRLESFLAALRVYNLDLRMTKGPHAETNIYAIRDGLFAVGDLMRRRRVAIEMTQEMLSSKSGIARRKISQFETGRPVNMEVGLFFKAAHVLGLEPVIEASMSWGRVAPHRFIQRSERMMRIQLSRTQERKELLLQLEEDREVHLLAALRVLDRVANGERLQTGFEPVERAPAKPVPQRGAFRRIDTLAADDDEPQSATGIAAVPAPSAADLEAEDAQLQSFADAVRDAEVSEAKRAVSAARYMAEIQGKPFDPDVKRRELESKGIVVPPGYRLGFQENHL